MVMTLEKWLEAHGISMIDFEAMSGVPYQRISEHIRLKKPLSERYVIKVLQTTKCDVSPEMLRPSLKPILQLINTQKRALVRRTAAFALSLAVVLVTFAAIVFQSPSDFSDSVIVESQRHYEEAKNAFSNNDLEFALSHLEAIEEKTPAWYESRELHWQVKEELNTYAHTKAEAIR
jgi:hypothetical protein